jgi:membrane dipeptidase
MTVIDMHEDTPLRFLDENYDIGSTNPNDPDFISLDKARAGNLEAIFFSIWVDPKTKQGRFAERAMDLIDSVYAQAAHHPDRLMMSFSAGDIERAHAQHKLAALMGIEGGHPIENDVRVLRDFYRLGVRYMTLTWRNTNDWADSSGDLDDPAVAHHNGLTGFGRQVIAEMNRLGMMIDISHVSDKTFWDVIAVTKAPIIASHSAARALNNQPRNMSDEMLRAVARNGGVVNVIFDNGFLDKEYDRQAELLRVRMLSAERDYKAKRQSAGKAVKPEDTQRFDDEWLATNQTYRSPMKMLIDHIDHVVKVAGIDHVGLGSDFGFRFALPEGIDSAADLPKITQVLLNRGYTPSDITKIMGANMLRVFREVERIGQDSQLPRDRPGAR